MNLDMATSSVGKGKILFVDCSSELPAYALDLKSSWCASGEPLPKMPSGTRDYASLLV